MLGVGLVFNTPFLHNPPFAPVNQYKIAFPYTFYPIIHKSSSKSFDK
jgi:hypothetical protein